MHRMLPNLRYAPREITWLGCLEGCLDYLDADITPDWLYGCSGYTFFLVIDRVLCPSAIHAHRHDAHALARHVGYVPDVYLSFKNRDDFGPRQRAAWDAARRGLSQDYPAFAWEWEWHLVYGHDDVGYHLRGKDCPGGRGPLPWQHLGNTDVGWLELCVIRPGQPTDPATAVKATLAFALDCAHNSEDYVLPSDSKVCGLGAYDAWIAALEQGSADGHGLAYCAAAWSECRQHAPGFLREARARLDAADWDPLEDAAQAYDSVSRNLSALTTLYPQDASSAEEKTARARDRVRAEKAVRYLCAARDAERGGLEILSRVMTST